MQVVMVLAGLRVTEAIGLLVHDVGHQVALDGSVGLTITPKEKHDTSDEHITSLPREGVAELRPWLDERQRMVKELALPGLLVFPANVLGGKMTNKTVYKQIRATFERAGLDISGAGGQRLRNTFAKEQLDNGSSPDQLKGFCRAVDQRRKLAETGAAGLTLDGPLLRSQKTGHISIGVTPTRPIST